MAEQDNKERKVLYGEENNGDSIAGTGVVLGIVLFLSAIANVAQIVIGLSENNLSIAELILRLAGIILTVFLAFRLARALQELGRLVAENAKLKTAVQYLFETHNIEVHSFAEAPEQEIPGAAGDGFETMRIEEDGVHFHKPGSTVKCPFCDHEQSAGIVACENCGQRFFFEE